MILTSTSRLLLPLLLVYSVYLLIRGHNEPGGGFTGGLVASAGFALYALANGVKSARRTVRVDLRTLMGAGLLIALASGVIPLFLGRPLFTGIWGNVVWPGILDFAVGTPQLFDFGVYLLVIGMALSILFALREEN